MRDKEEGVVGLLECGWGLLSYSADAGDRLEGGWNRIMKERMSRRRSENTKLLPGYSLPLQ